MPKKTETRTSWLLPTITERGAGRGILDLIGLALKIQAEDGIRLLLLRIAWWYILVGTSGRSLGKGNIDVEEVECRARHSQRETTCGLNILDGKYLDSR